MGYLTEVKAVKYIIMSQFYKLMKVKVRLWA